ncbi:MAG: hypothetical protein AAF682_00205 [Planctomycetota bacterium]
MSTIQASRKAIQQFSDHYRYDMSYQTELLESAPEAFRVFVNAQGTSGHRRVLPLDAHYVARVAMMQAEDCGDCVQVNLRMAVEAGVERELLDTLLREPDQLAAELRDVRDHAFDVAMQPIPDEARARRLREVYGRDGFAELSVCLAGCRLFTTVKRSLGKASPCEVLDGDF